MAYEEIEYDRWEGPTREQLHAALDRILDKGRIERKDDGWPDVDRDRLAELQDFFSAVRDGHIDRDCDGDAGILFHIEDRKKYRLPAAWVTVPNKFPDTEEMREHYAGAVGHLTSIVSELARTLAYSMGEERRKKEKS